MQAQTSRSSALIGGKVSPGQEIQDLIRRRKSPSNRKRSSSPRVTQALFTSSASPSIHSGVLTLRTVMRYCARLIRAARRCSEQEWLPSCPCFQVYPQVQHEWVSGLGIGSPSKIRELDIIGGLASQPGAHRMRRLLDVIGRLPRVGLNCRLVPTEPPGDEPNDQRMKPASEEAAWSEAPEVHEVTKS